jgi:hypothetical protein|tara:strand:+ start:350 stop:748 length:399 start_codon:yes stop_codon:yes gene_type:complete
MESLGRKEAQLLSQQGLESLQETFKNMGLTVESNGARYGEGNKVDLKFSVVLPSMNNVIVNENLQAAGVTDLKVGDTFFDNTNEYRIVGYNHKARKYPVQIMRLSDSSRRKAPVSFVQHWLKDPKNFKKVGG